MLKKNARNNMREAAVGAQTLLKPSAFDGTATTFNHNINRAVNLIRVAKWWRGVSRGQGKPVA